MKHETSNKPTDQLSHFGGLVQQLQDQSPEPLVWSVEGILTEQ